MTENADVQWLRRIFDVCKKPIGECTSWVRLDCDKARRLLAHIDQLGRDIEDFKKDALRRALCNEPEPDSRPSVHDIAAQILGSVSAVSSMDYAEDAKFAYDAAEALVAEGRRRDGLSNA